jgi:hypothetical protein
MSDGVLPPFQSVKLLQIDFWASVPTAQNHISVQLLLVLSHLSSAVGSFVSIILLDACDIQTSWDKHSQIFLLLHVYLFTIFFRHSRITVTFTRPATNASCFLIVVSLLVQVSKSLVKQALRPVSGESRLWRALP